MKKVKLSEVLESYIDYRGKTPKKLGEEWSSTGYRALSALQVKTEGLQNMDKCYFASEKLYKKWMKEKVEKGDILLTSEAPAGQVYYWNSDEKIVLSQRLFCLKIKKLYDAQYIKYYLQSDIGQREIFNNNTGSTAKGISAKTFNNINVLVRGLETEQKIAAILSSLDDKIELNSRIAGVLEKMMREIYDYWFVQFDFPDENGKPYQSNGGKMVFNPQLKRNIPQGWEVKKLGDFLNKKTAKSKTNNIPTIDLSIMPSNKFFLTEWSNGEKFKTQLIQAQAGDLLFGSIRPYLKKAGIMPISGGVGQTVYLYTVTYEHNYNFCFCTLTSEDVFQHAITRSKGTRMPVIDSDELLSFQVPYNEQIVKKYNEIINIKQTMISLSQQTQTLTALRDFLLPLLMNGQASVR
ncbi:MAG: restriction endonuclease subunit S [Neisseriaceae bacterium]|nr:restriction endonuclease subunit S [Neisseriaceae bacterium]